MYYVIFAIAGYIAYMFGVLAFSQIIGSIRAGKHMFALVFWSALTIAVYGLVCVYLNKYSLAVIIGLVISLLAVLTTPKIE